MPSSPPHSLRKPQVKTLSRTNLARGVGSKIAAGSCMQRVFHIRWRMLNKMEKTEPKAQFFSRQILADFHFSWFPQHVGGADFCRKRRRLCGNHLFHLVCPFYLLPTSLAKLRPSTRPSRKRRLGSWSVCARTALWTAALHLAQEAPTTAKFSVSFLAILSCCKLKPKTPLRMTRRLPLGTKRLPTYPLTQHCYLLKIILQ